jgi:Family of unknown function (DUF6152)
VECPFHTAVKQMNVASLIFVILLHHSFAAEFDSNKPVELKGTVTKLDWVNPHAWIFLDVKDGNGNNVNWACELGSPNILLRNGWKRDSLKAGDVVVINGSAAKDGSHVANARTVRMEDGKRIFNAGSSGDQPQ